MSIQNILNRTHMSLVTIRPEDTAETAAQLLTSNNIGALLVRDADGQMAGVISERDIVKTFARRPNALMDLRVEDLMTREITFCRASESVKDAMEKMSRHHIRHLPVLNDSDELLGIISIRDVMTSRLEESELEASELRAYAIAAGGAGSR